MIDAEALRRLQEWGGPKLVREMIRLFLDNAGERIDQIRAGFGDGDAELVGRSAHSLKSSSANVGASEVSDLARKIELLTAKGDLDRARESEAGLIAAFERARAELVELEAGDSEPRRTIAVVEDNPDNRLLVQAILEDRYDISEYETGTEAVEGLRAHKPDLVLLDISLPEMDGTEVLRWIREQEDFRGLPVIALTAHAMAGDRDKYLGYGFDDYLTKPIIDENVLLEAIERWLSRSP